MAEDADMRNELEEMQRRADQLADEVRDGDLGREQKMESCVVCLIQVEVGKGLLMSQKKKQKQEEYDFDFLYI